MYFIKSAVRISRNICSSAWKKEAGTATDAPKKAVPALMPALFYSFYVLSAAAKSARSSTRTASRASALTAPTATVVVALAANLTTEDIKFVDAAQHSVLIN